MKSKKKNYYNKSGGYQKQDKKINPILVKKYIKYIDWILLVYFYEEAKMQEMIEIKTYTKKQVIDFCEEKREEEKNNLDLLEKQKVQEDDVIKIEKIIKATYPYELSTKIPTKSSVTKIKQQNEEKLEVNFGIPKFMEKEETTKLTGAQKGTLLHLCMQKLDIHKDYDLSKVKELIKTLQTKEIITKLEAENINVLAILKFTTTRHLARYETGKIDRKRKAILYFGTRKTSLPRGGRRRYFSTGNYRLVL